MFKERSLPYNYGETLNGLPMYASLSSYLGPNPEDGLEVFNDVWGSMEAARSHGKKVASLQLPYKTTVVLGHETLSSTTNKPPLFNACTHNVLEGVNFPVTVLFSGYRSRVNLYFYYRYTTTSVNNVAKITNHFHTDIGSAQRTAWGIMQPRFEGDISMFNFIVELKDFRSLARFLMNKPVKKLSNMFRRWKSSPKFDLTKPAAELHLANEFALKPLMSDIYTILSQMKQTVDDAQKKFSDAGTERNSRHYSEVFQISENNIMNAYQQKQDPQYMIGDAEQLKFTATMEYSYEYNVRNSLDAILRYYGFYPDLEAIWNAIPFSFLVDYVVQIGKALAINSRDKNVLLTLSQYCESIHSERTSGLHFKSSRLLAPMLGDSSATVRLPGSVGNNLVHGNRASLYSRILTKPNKGLALPRMKKPSTKQGWNILALARSFF
jgi:hypothetical protein